jgi:bifunctional non-homologous end joining protein LigD
VADQNPRRPAAQSSTLPKWIKPQLTKLVDEAPIGDGWLHEIKYDPNAYTRAICGTGSRC